MMIACTWLALALCAGFSTGSLASRSRSYATGGYACYQCASPHVVWHIDHFLVVRDDVVYEADKSCIRNITHKNDTPCSGLCMTLNVTGYHNGQLATYGVLRDCRSRFYKQPLNSSLLPTCHVERKIIKDKTYFAEYCFCRGTYCNGRIPDAMRDGMAYRRALARGYAIGTNTNGLANVKASVAVLVALWAALLF